MALNTKVKGLQLNDEVLGLGLIRNPSDANVMDIDFANIAGVGLNDNVGVLSVDLNELESSIETWAETQPAGDVDRTFDHFSISDDGNILIAEVNAGRLYTSSDGGANWTERQPAGNVNQNWHHTALSSDGSIMYACVYNGRIYKSVDYGVNWVDIQATGNVNKLWDIVSCSDDGTIVLAGTWGQRLYRSIDSGATFVETQPDGNVNAGWHCQAVSSDGSVMYVGKTREYPSLVFTGRLWVSSDYGATWTETQPAGDVSYSYNTIAISANGSSCVTGVNNRLYMTEDYGANWSEIQPAGDIDGTYSGISLSDDGNVIFINRSGLRAHISRDGGATWNEVQPLGDIDNAWSLNDMDASGTNFIINSPTRLYVGEEIIVVVDESEDLIPFIDITDGSSKKVTINDLALALAGTGLTALNGKFTVDEIADNITEADFVRSFQTMTGGEIALPSFSGGFPVVENSVQVFLNGLLQEPGVGNDYTLEASTGIVSFPGGDGVWTQRLASDGSKNYWSQAISDDGSNIIAVQAWVGRAYLSTNGGVSWTETQPDGDADKQWYGTASNGDGSVLLAGQFEGYLFLSTDSGASWSEITPAGAGIREWRGMCSSVLGDVLIVADGLNEPPPGTGKLYMSTNYGVSFSEIQPAGATTHDWYDVDCSADGSVIIACGKDDYVYVSTNSGANWTQTTLPLNHWRNICCSGNGQYLGACAYGGRLYTSDDYGATWTERQPAGAINQNWNTIASNGTGSYLLAGVWGGRLWASYDYGITWTEEQPDGDVTRTWAGTAISYDGSVSSAGQWGGKLFTNNTSPSDLVAGDLVAMKGLLDN